MSIDWNDVRRRYPAGKNFRGQVARVWPAGAFVQLEDGLSGLVTNQEIAWDHAVVDATSLLREHQPVDVQVIRVEDWHQRIVLSIRRAAFDPWDHCYKKYRPGITSRGRVTRLARDEVLIEFEDHVSGFIPRDQVVKGEGKAEELLEVGDWVEVIVQERLDQDREIKGSMRARLEAIAREVETVWQNFGHAEATAPTDAITLAPGQASAETETEPSNIGAPLSILVAEDDEGQRKQLCAVLQDLGLRDIEEAADWRSAAEKGIARQFDLALIDLEMPAGNGEAGLRAIEEIHKHRPDTKIALVTGNRLPWERRENAPVGLCGLVPKPFSLEQIRTAMRRFLDTGDVGWPEDRRIGAPASDPQGMQFVESISRAARVARPLRESLTAMLQQLKIETGACATAVFSWNRQNKQVSLEASVQIPEGEFERCRLNLSRSPVADLVYQPEQPIFFNDIESEAEGKFLYLRPLLGKRTSWVMQACIGEVIADEGETVETLFVFGDRAGQFRSEHRLLTRATGAVLAAVLREHWIIQQVVAERRLTTLGGILTSATHELKGRLSALEAVDAVARSWRKLRSQPELVRDEKSLQEMDERIQSFTVAKKAMDTVVARILGWASADVVELVDLRVRLDNAVQACALEARKSNVVVIREFEYLPSVMGNPIELEQAFLNLILNAIHQMKGTGRKSGVLRIETRQVVGTERPVQIRFCDTGPGIHSRYLDTTMWGEERIFQPLFTTKRAGTGMGLYITRGLLANHGGSVRVEKTAILAGTTFLVELPLRGGI